MDMSRPIKRPWSGAGSLKAHVMSTPIRIKPEKDSKNGRVTTTDWIVTPTLGLLL